MIPVETSAYCRSAQPRCRGPMPGEALPTCLSADTLPGANIDAADGDVIEKWQCILLT